MQDAEYARKVIEEIERDVKSTSKRKAIAASFARNLFGKLSQDAVNVYLEYSK